MSAAPDRATTALDPQRLRKGVLLAVAIGITVGVAVAVVIDGPAVLAGIRKISPVWALVALVMSALSWLGQGIGFAALTSRGVKGNVVSMTRAFLGGDFPALVTPFGSGGIPGGVFCLTREGLSAGEASAVIAMHSLLTGAFFVLVGVVAAVTLPVRGAGSSVLVWSGFTGILGAVVLIVWMVLHPQRATGWLKRFLAGHRVRRVLGDERADRIQAAAEREAEEFSASVKNLTNERPGAVALSLAGLAVSRVLLIGTLPVIMYGLGWRGDIVPLIATAIGAMALAIASPTPGGSGAVEAALVALLATQTSAPMAAAAALLWRAITYYTELLAGWAVFSHYLVIAPGASWKASRR